MPAKKAEARGYRNNNPLNIKKTGDKWQGLADPQTDPVFCSFISPEYGIRAATKILNRYINVYRANTIEKIIDRWAPTSENHTQNYINFVSGKMGVAPDTVIDWFELPELIQAMAEYENGYKKYSLATIKAGMELAV